MCRFRSSTRSGQIRVDGARAKPDTRLTTGAQVRVPPLPDASEVSELREGLSERDIAFARSLVLHQDDEVLVLNKPSGLAVQGGTKTTRHVDRLLSAWGEGVDRPRLVHRLDRDTSGVLVLGKTPNATARLASYFANRKAQKTYWAIVAGAPTPADDVIDIPLVKKGQGDREMVQPAASGEYGSEQAESEYATLGQSTGGVSWLALRPHTGRTHQLRAHMKAVGHAILGDPKYGDDSSKALSTGLKLQLHARRLVMPHPSRGTLTLEAPISPELRAGFYRFGFDENAADPEPFGAYGSPSRKRSR